MSTEDDDARPGTIRGGFNMIVRDVDRAWANWRPPGLFTFLWERARYAYWTESILANLDDPVPFKLDFKALTKLAGCGRTALYDVWNEMILMHIVTPTLDNLFLIQKDYRRWTRKDGVTPLLSPDQKKDAKSLQRFPGDSKKGSKTESVKSERIGNELSVITERINGELSVESEHVRHINIVRSVESDNLSVITDKHTIEDQARVLKEKENNTNTPLPPEGAVSGSVGDSSNGTPDSRTPPAVFLELVAHATKIPELKTLAAALPTLWELNGTLRAHWMDHHDFEPWRDALNILAGKPESSRHIGMLMVIAIDKSNKFQAAKIQAALKPSERSERTFNQAKPGRKKPRIAPKGKP